MNILVLNGSPAGQNSITLQTVIYIQQFYDQYHFDVLDVGQRIKQYEKDFSECKEKIKAADLILFTYPVYTFLIPAQLHRFIELMKEADIDYSKKYASQITTSKHFYDVTAHRYIQDNCDDMGLMYIKGLSADMEDLLSKKGQHEALAFFRYVQWSYQRGYHEPVLYAEKKEFNGIEPAIPEREVLPKRGKIAIVTDTTEDSPLYRMIQRFQYKTSFETVVVNLKEFPFSGGCLGCFHCASTGKCIYKDGFDAYLRNNIQTTDATVYAFSIKDHGMGYRFKLYDDRQFCNGHRTVTMGKPVGYLIDGNLDEEPNLRMVIEARADTGGNYLAGIAQTKVIRIRKLTGWQIRYSMR
ncbi:MAG: NAD(P)H-dependent oxidoreductase [Solobacterium sp.]|nr:NAD(P)H-dependent oxidoreductase [Solobacterium sp.]